MNIHIVDSVKGGAGKSTFACKLALYLMCGTNRSSIGIEPGKYNRTRPEKNHSVCIIDVDLLGTSWQYAFYRAIKKKSEVDDQFVYLNDLIMDFEYYKNKEFVQNIELLVDGFNYECINVIMCNPAQGAKNMFRINPEMTVSDIQLDRFSCNINKLVDLLKEQEYSDVIFDMPPNSDLYTDTIIHNFMNADSAYAASLYVVSTYDIAHIESTIDWYDKYINANVSQHIISINREIDSIKKEGLSDPEYAKRKAEWFKNTKMKYFAVFNNNYGLQNNSRPITYNRKIIFQAISKSYRFYDIIYLFEEFDTAFSASRAQTLTSADPGPIRIGNTVNAHEFYTYDDIKDGR